MNDTNGNVVETIVEKKVENRKRFPCRSAYLGSILDEERLQRVVKNLVKVIKKKIGVDNFDAIVYRGMSGAGVGTTLGYLLRKPLVMVRKKEVESHSGHIVEGAMNVSRILVVDDCISTGSTLMETVKAVTSIEVWKCDPIKVVAVLLYNDCSEAYHILTGEERFEDRFRTIFTERIRFDKQNRSALDAMSDMKVYGFSITHCVEDGVSKYKLVKGNNLNID